MWDMGLVEPVTLSLVSDLYNQQLEAAGIDPNSSILGVTCKALSPSRIDVADNPLSTKLATKGKDFLEVKCEQRSKKQKVGCMVG